MDLVNFWENSAAKAHKHFATELPSTKKKRLRDRFKKHTTDQIDMSKVELAIDWGCGGGLLAKTMPEHIRLIAVDISEESLDRTESYVGHELTKIQINDPATFKYDQLQADLLWCYSVIHHFPDLDYWMSIASLWDEIAPKRIAMQTKIGEENLKTDNYEDDYTNALILTKKSLLDPFENYDVKYFKVEKIPASWNFGFAVLERK